MRCRGCGVNHPASTFPPDGRTRTGRSYFCRACCKAGKARSKEGQSSRHYHLLDRYGIGAADVERIIEAQGGLCAVCRKHPPTQVDHDHETGLVRGVLCDGCNGGLGHFRDDPDLIRRAIAYVRSHR